MSKASQKPPAPLADSPWFWAYVFCTAGLIALVLMGPKFSARQTQIERQDQGRNRALLEKAGKSPDQSVSAKVPRSITLRPLYIVLGCLLVLAWSRLLWQRFGRGQVVRAPGNSPHHPARPPSSSPHPQQDDPGR